MALTLRAVLDELTAWPWATSTTSGATRSSLVARAHAWRPRRRRDPQPAAARRGRELISRPGELIDPVLVAAAMARAADRAYGSVRARRGAILTVVRDGRPRSVDVAHMDEPRS
jgi:hypothetical protein